MHKQLPRKLDIWIEDKDDGKFIANVHHYPDRRPISANELESPLKTNEPVIKNKNQIENERTQKIREFSETHSSLSKQDIANEYDEMVKERNK